MFDWNRFERELLPVLEAAFKRNDITELRCFILSNIDSMKDPNEGDPLRENWEATLEYKDVQEYADFALTLFYDPFDDCGIDDWVEVSDSVSKECRAALLGFSIRFGSIDLDPGRMGSYFMNTETVRSSNATIAALKMAQLKKFKNLLSRSIETVNGVYITF